MGEIESFRKKLQSLSKEEIADLNKKELEEHYRQHKLFEKEFSSNYCYLCNQELTFFDKETPCLHWLLKRNKRFKTKDFKLIYHKYGYFQISSYLRWVANFGEKFQYINDLEEEKNPKKLFEYTIKYESLEWSFSCTKGDYDGHKDGQVDFPHYHFQMRVDGQRFIQYNHFHVIFSEEDLFKMKIKLGEIPEIKHSFGNGGGMQDFFGNLSPEEIAENMRFTEDEGKALIHTSYFIQAKEGETIKGEDIQKMFDLRKKEGKSLWHYKDFIPNASIKAIISPGEGVPPIAGRKGGRGSNKRTFH